MPARPMFDQMPLMDAHTLLTLVVLAGGSGIFLRLVAKEKRRREKHLGLRLLGKAKELEEETRLKQLLEGARRNGEEEDDGDTQAAEGRDGENGESGG